MRELPEAATSSASTATAPSTTCAAGRTSRRTGRLGAVQAAQLGRRLLAGRRAPPDAAAHLRHRLGVPGGPGPLPVARWRRPRSATTASSAATSTCSPSIPSRRPPRSGIRRGMAAVASAGALVPRGAALGRLRRGARRRAWCARSCGRPPATGSSTRTTCSSSTTTSTSPGLKPMNCPEDDPDLQDQGALLPRPADPLRRLLGRSSARSDRRAGRACSACGSSTQDDSHVFCRDDQVDRRDQPRARPGAPAVTRRSASSRTSSSPRGRRSGWAPTSSGTWPRASCKRRWSSRARRTRSIRAAARSTRRRSTSSSRTRSAGSGRCATVQLDYQLPAALRPGVPRGRWRLRAAGDGPLRHLRLVRALHRRSSPSTSRAPSRCGWRRCR